MSDNIVNGNGCANGIEAKMRPLWEPEHSRHNHGEKLPIRQFISRIQLKFGVDFSVDAEPYVGLDEYGRLHKWSVLNPADFWREVADFCDLQFHTAPDGIIDTDVPMPSIPKWFSGATLNYAQHLLCKASSSDHQHQTAIHWFREDFDVIDSHSDRSPAQRSVTFGELQLIVAEYAAAMKKLGVEKGDTVAGYLPNCIETIVASLAASSLGAAWVSTSPDFGADAVLARFEQVQPKLLFSIESVIYKNKRHEHLAKLEAVVKGLPSLKKVVLIPYVTTVENQQQLREDTKHIPNLTLVNDFVNSGRNEDGSIPVLEFVPVPFDHPLFVMFSSGTTGKPKCMVHSVGGTLIKHMCEHVLSNCMTADDVIFFYTTCGWMMWNWLITALTIGSTLVLFDGSPFERNLTSIFDIADQTKMTVLGMGAACYEHYESKQLSPAKSHRLSDLRMVLSTGSPLPAHTFQYIYSDIKSDLCIGSISGGTDIIGCFVGGSMLRPVYAGECQAILLGCDIQCWDASGNEITDAGGELVCATPFPSMPTHFLNDPERSKYSAAYFERFDGVWTHGDFMMINAKTGGITMLGRSDAVLNPGGVRFGPAEIYEVVETIPCIADSLAIGVIRPDLTEKFVLFVKMAADAHLTDEIERKVAGAIRAKKSPKFLPSLIVECPDVPYTSNGKKVEMAVRKLLSGRPVDNESSLRNPQSLDFFREWHEQAQLTI